MNNGSTMYKFIFSDVNIIHIYDNNGHEDISIMYTQKKSEIPLLRSKLVHNNSL